MNIDRSVLSKIDLFREFWERAVDYQKRQRSRMAWHDFPQELIASEIAAGNNFTVAQTNEILGYFSLIWRDAAIWDERERGDAIYLHRMCANPDQKGGRLAETILKWALEFAREQDKKFVRIDTWRESPDLIAYYQKIGFKLVGEKQLGEDASLQPHYRNIKLALFENEV